MPLGSTYPNQRSFWKLNQMRQYLEGSSSPSLKLQHELSGHEDHQELLFWRGIQFTTLARKGYCTVVSVICKKERQQYNFLGSPASNVYGTNLAAGLIKILLLENLMSDSLF